MTLPFFYLVNKIVSIHDAFNDGQPSAEGIKPSTVLPGASPKAILLLSWGDAKPPHIAKYSSLFIRLYPKAKIILVETGMADFFWRPERTQRKLVEPIVKILDDLADDTLLVHVMSNAGSTRWAIINKLYVQSTGRTLSSAVTILDSAPVARTFNRHGPLLILPPFN
jgi:hypothetical protein